MDKVRFASAKAVFAPFNEAADNAVNQYGFYYGFNAEKKHNSVRIRITARSIFRLYVNGEIIINGPARTAKGYCRVDTVDITDKIQIGVNHIGVEVVEYNVNSPCYGGYSNDSTLEAGLLTAEIECDGAVLGATGVDEWRVCRIKGRVPNSERISHCRQAAEIYMIEKDFHLWKTGQGEFEQVKMLDEEPLYIAHNALVPENTVYHFNTLLEYGACRIDNDKKIIRRRVDNSPYFNTLEEHPLYDYKRTVRSFGSVQVKKDGEGITFIPRDTCRHFAYFECGECHVGFIRLRITAEKDGIIDIVHGEVIDLGGMPLSSYNTVTRLHVRAGETDFIAMEPALARYIALYFCGTGAVCVKGLSILNDSYPDNNDSSFLCSDEDINRLYNAAKKTLLLNTKDIFMDCPERERGGWLCDSLWTGRAAMLMLSDSRVEKEFLENFLLTDALEMERAFFPAVYPAYMPDYKNMVGITTWSFWLMIETCEFIRRTGDVEFGREHLPRIEAFVEGSKTFIGKCGLLENLPNLFIDWSLSNNDSYKLPISTAANALYARMLTELAEVYDKPEWKALGEGIREILRKIILKNTDIELLKNIPDQIEYDGNGEAVARWDKLTEAAMYTSLWSGLFDEDEAPLLIGNVRDAMGPAPTYPSDPNIGQSGLFIGLCIRLDMLARQNNKQKMLEDMLAIYMPQLKEGPGTLWEHRVIEANSRCHGFNSHAGVHLMRDILGLGIPTENKGGTAEIRIEPEICLLRWARGTHLTKWGMVSAAWQYDGKSFRLDVSLPENMAYKVKLPREARGLLRQNVTVTVNGQVIELNDVQL